MSTSLRASMIALVGFAFLQLPLYAADEKPKLEGQHQVISGEHDGKAMTPAELQGVTFRFTGEKVVGATKNGTAFLTAEYTLDAAKKPCAITMKLTEGSDKGKELHGLVERTNDTIRIIYAGPGAPAPTEFKTKLNQAMYTLKAESNNKK
ncbi:MAG TPA: TIGR03067 domain-containing protein [Gemmata sp.]|nr:TIGR03067 domain-containing protein [Gemmata sp.]